MSITERCISFNEINYNFANGLDWPLNISTKEVLDHDMVEKDDEQDSGEENEEAQEDQEAIKNKKLIHYKVHSVRNVGWTQRQLIILTIQQQGEDKKWTS